MSLKNYRGHGELSYITLRIGYYDVFPPKSVDVTIETRADRKVIVASKDFAAGELIYKVSCTKSLNPFDTFPTQENAVVTALDADLAAAGTHCTHCLRHIENDMSLPLSEESTRLPGTFCSKECLVAHKSQSHSLLFTTESPLPLDITPGPIPPDVIEQRKQAQDKFAAYIKEGKLARPLLVARFVARQVSLETNKIVDSVRKTTPEKSDFMDAEDAGYLLADHMERLRSIDTVPPKEEHPLLVEVLKHALPGLEHFVLDERHTTLHGKMAYNAFGVTFDGGRGDKVGALLLPTNLHIDVPHLLDSLNPKPGQRMSRRHARPTAPTARLAAPSTRSLPIFLTPAIPLHAHLSVLEQPSSTWLRPVM